MEASKTLSSERRHTVLTVTVARGRTDFDMFCPQANLTNPLQREPVSRNWPLVCLELLAQCPKVEDQQGMADLAALRTPEGVASLSFPLRFRAEETKRFARRRPLHPGTLAWLAD